MKHNIILTVGIVFISLAYAEPLGPGRVEVTSLRRQVGQQFQTAFERGFKEGYDRCLETVSNRLAPPTGGQDMGEMPRFFDDFNQPN